MTSQAATPRSDAFKLAQHLVARQLIQSNNHQALRTLLKSGDVDATYTPRGYQPLMVYAVVGDAEKSDIIHLLADYEADVDTCDTSYNGTSTSVLSMCINKYRHASAIVLVRAGADIMASDALHRAVFNDMVWVVAEMYEAAAVTRTPAELAAYFDTVGTLGEFKGKKPSELAVSDAMLASLAGCQRNVRRSASQGLCTCDACVPALLPAVDDAAPTTAPVPSTTAPAPAPTTPAPAPAPTTPVPTAPSAPVPTPATELARIARIHAILTRAPLPVTDAECIARFDELGRPPTHSDENKVHIMRSYLSTLANVA